ncbi:MAG: hypothetical protein ACLUEQ_11175 [Cloacibacillus evryensis]
MRAKEGTPVKAAADGIVLREQLLVRRQLRLPRPRRGARHLLRPHVKSNVVETG